MSQVILGICGLLVVGSIGFYLACIVCIWKFFGAPPVWNGSPLPSSRPEGSGSLSFEERFEEPVSILVPVCGLDAGAWENWTSLCEQTYADYEVLFGVVNPLDPAVPVLYELVQKYPDRVRVFTGLAPRGVNHKDSTLSYLVEEMRHEVIIFADSDIRVPHRLHPHRGHASGRAGSGHGDLRLYWAATPVYGRGLSVAKPLLRFYSQCAAGPICRWRHPVCRGQHD